MINGICISINNRCNFGCKYCHFHEKGILDDVDVFKILDNVKTYAKGNFNIGFVENGEGLLDWLKLKSYIAYLEDYPNISSYIITNGTVPLNDEDWSFLENHNANVGFSIDDYKELHTKNRGNCFDKAMHNVEAYKHVTGHYLTFNAIVGEDSLLNADKVINFFKPFGVRVTFSIIIGRYGISLQEYRDFLECDEKKLEVRRGGLDCTMYDWQCGAGTNNYFFVNGYVYFCGNCIDLPHVGKSNMTFEELEKISLDFDRNNCYRESL